LNITLLKFFWRSLDFAYFDIFALEYFHLKNTDALFKKEAGRFDEVWVSANVEPLCSTGEV